MDKYQWGVKTDRPWTDAEVEKAKAWRAEGRSASWIAQELGRSRNSVIGKLHRAGAAVPQGRRFWNPNRVYRLRRLYFGTNGYSQDELAKQMGCSKAVLQKGINLIRGAPTMSRKLTSTMPKRANPVNPAASPDATQIVAQINAPVHPNGEPRGPKQLWELSYGECKWPFGDFDFTFCCQPAIKDQPYCPKHARLARGH